MMNLPLLNARISSLKITSVKKEKKKILNVTTHLGFPSAIAPGSVMHSTQRNLNIFEAFWFFYLCTCLYVTKFYLSRGEQTPCATYFTILLQSFDLLRSKLDANKMTFPSWHLAVTQKCNRRAKYERKSLLRTAFRKNSKH